MENTIQTSATKMDNLRYIMYSCLILHNLYIDTDDTYVWDLET